jgi:hypothetical protein
MVRERRPRQREDTVAVDLHAYRLRAEEFIGALDREHYLHYSGQKDDSDSASIYDRFQELFSRQTLDELDGLYHTSTDEDERRRLAYLLTFVTESFIGEQVKELSDRLAETEAAASIEVDGEKVPYRFASVVQANEPDRARRRTIYDARRRVVSEQLNPLYDEYWRRAHAVAGELGYPTYEALFAEIKAMDHGLFRGEMEALLQDTDNLYERSLAALVRDKLGLSLDELAPWDMPYLFRAPEYDAHFAADRLLPTLSATLAGLGIDLAAQTNVHLDTESREKKSPRAFCAPVRVPDEIYLCVLPQGGQDDYQALLHEAGHTEHFAHVSPDLLFEYRYLGDNAVTESFAFLFDHLVADPDWLAHHLDYTDSGGFVRFGNISDLYFVRRYVAKLVYELRLHEQTGSLDAMAGVYHDTLSAATLVDFPADWYLTDVDDGFYVISYLRAWLLEAAWRVMLQGEFGPGWFANPAAGEKLKALWGLGQKYNSPRLLLKHGGGRLDAGPLLYLLNRALGR